MKAITCCCLLLSTLTALGQEALKQTSCGVTERKVTSETFSFTNTISQPKTFHILSLPAPGVTSPAYGISGSLKYENVEGTAYLEMLSHFAGGKTYFTKTMAPDGLLLSIQGSSDWRQFNLPFYVRDESGWLADRPERLEVNLVLPGKGTVHLQPMTLHQALEGHDAKARDAWWTDRFGNKMGGIVGSMIGIFGAVVGLLAGQAKARMLVMSLLWLILLFGTCSLIAGIIALFRSQPYMVFYPLLLVGGISTLTPAFCIPLLKKRYEALELRQISSMDA
jgi:hypothetical protein